MANFELIFNKTMENEGGFVLHQVKGDRGGQTYAGIARKFHPDWKGWKFIDSGAQVNITNLVREFYHDEFWEKIRGDEIIHNDVAYNIFDFAVNCGLKTSAKFTQTLSKVTVDGYIGPKTMEALHQLECDNFIEGFYILKVARYTAICNRDSSQRKFLLGWINRCNNVLKGV